MGLFDLFTDKKKVIGFSLENVHAEHQKNPRHFLIPSQEEINQCGSNSLKSAMGSSKDV